MFNRSRQDPPGVIRPDEETMARFTAMANERGLSHEAFIRVMVTAFDRKPQNYDFGDTIKFGKYYGLELEEVIRADPGYFVWLLRESTWLKLSSRALNLLHALTD